jgi:hypothetical protein
MPSTALGTTLSSGFLIVSNERLLNSIGRLRWVWLVGALGLLVWQILSDLASSQIQVGSATYKLDMDFREPMAYMTIFSLLGFGMRNWIRNSPVLSRLNEGVLPFYILHQPVILLLGYYIIPIVNFTWPLPRDGQLDQLAHLVQGQAGEVVVDPDAVRFDLARGQVGRFRFSTPRLGKERLGHILA